MADSTEAERRVDVLTGRSVIVASGRADRPIAVSSTVLPPCAADDPFLQGHEHDTPNETLALRHVDTVENQPGWLVRVVPNRYPAVMGLITPPCPSSRSAADNRDQCFDARGIHDVVIECPDLRSRMVDLSVIEIARVLIVWQKRLRQIRDHHGALIAAVNIFRNEGAGAGASLPHCHSQILATGFVPEQLQARIDAADRYHTETGHRLFRAWLNAERNDGRRIMLNHDNIVAVCPFASRVPWHVRICSNDESDHSWDSLSERRLITIADVLRRILCSLHQVAGPIDHNVTLTLPPLARPDAFPWMLDLLPRPNRMAGFELMTDVDIVTRSPETSASELSANLSPPDNDAITEPLAPAEYHWYRVD